MLTIKQKASIYLTLSHYSFKTLYDVLEMINRDMGMNLQRSKHRGRMVERIMEACEQHEEVALVLSKTPISDDYYAHLLPLYKRFSQFKLTKIRSIVDKLANQGKIKGITSKERKPLIEHILKYAKRNSGTLKEVQSLVIWDF